MHEENFDDLGYGVEGEEGEGPGEREGAAGAAQHETHRDADQARKEAQREAGQDAVRAPRNAEAEGGEGAGGAKGRGGNSGPSRFGRLGREQERGGEGRWLEGASLSYEAGQPYGLVKHLLRAACGRGENQHHNGN